MLERQREGIAKAKREGRYEGRVPTVRRQAAEKSSGSKSWASGPRESPASWGLDGRVCIGFGRAERR